MNETGSVQWNVCFRMVWASYTSIDFMVVVVLCYGSVLVRL